MRELENLFPAQYDVSVRRLSGLHSESIMVALYGLTESQVRALAELLHTVQLTQIPEAS